jgi:RHS repeat-associated protein
VQTQYSYEPFGNTTSSGLSVSNPAQYTGRENDGTGLYYYRARYYDPVLGRFVSEDPIGFLGGSNFYRYVSNDPSDLIDPFGLASQAALGPFVCTWCGEFDAGLSLMWSSYDRMQQMPSGTPLYSARTVNGCWLAMSPMRSLRRC